MLAGIQVSSDIHGCKESVVDSVTGYLCKKQDAENLYQVMKHFTELSNIERREMGLAGRKYMEDVFGKKVVVATTLSAC